MKVFLIMASVLVVSMVVFPADIRAQRYSPNAWQAEVEARSRAWQRTQEDLQRGRAETQQRMREAWERTRNQARDAWQRHQETVQRMEENRAKMYSTWDRTYKPGERHWSERIDPRDGGRGAARGAYVRDYSTAREQLRREAAERQRQAAAQRARDDSRLMGGPNYRPQPRTPVTVRDGGPRDRDVPQRLSPAAAAAIRDIERQLTGAQKSTGRDTGGRSSGQSSPSRSESPQRESKSWQDDVREKMDRRN
jgi:hypothetical protein